MDRLTELEWEKWMMEVSKGCTNNPEVAERNVKRYHEICNEIAILKAKRVSL